MRQQKCKPPTSGFRNPDGSIFGLPKGTRAFKAPPPPPKQPKSYERRHVGYRYRPTKPKEGRWGHEEKNELGE
jgi:hypothetical protein